MELRGIASWTLLLALLTHGAVANAQTRFTERSATTDDADAVFVGDTKETEKDSSAEAFLPPSSAPGPLPDGTDLYLWYLNATWMGKTGDAELVETDLTPDAVAFLGNAGAVATHYATPGSELRRRCVRAGDPRSHAGPDGRVQLRDQPGRPARAGRFPG